MSHSSRLPRPLCTRRCWRRPSSGFTGPSSFGSGDFTVSTNGIGDFVGIYVAANQLYVPPGYVSGAALSSSGTWNNTTFATLGVTPGTYVWTWGTGADQNFTLVIEGPGVPDSPVGLSVIAAVFLMLFGAKQCELRRSSSAALPQI